MLDYTEMSTKSRRRLPGVWTLILAMLLFAMTLTGVALLEASRSQSSQGDQSLNQIFNVNRLWSHFQLSSNKTDDEIAATVERIARDAKANASQIVNGHSNNYYEEQSAVLVNSESAQPRSDSDETDPYYDAAAEDYFNGQQLAESDDSYSDADSSVPSESEGRSAQGRPVDSFYGKWQYATQTPSPVTNNRKLQPVAVNR
ncbi:GH24954 [Drosophila grimshawi]|nr:GH24954 [Drosophila grimshawi]